MADIIHHLLNPSEAIIPSLQRTYTNTLDSINSKTYLRVIVIFGVYMALRPFIVRFFAYTQKKSDTSQKVLDAALTKKGPDEWQEGLVSLNALRGNKGGFGGADGKGGVDGGKSSGVLKGGAKEARKRREKEIAEKIKNGTATDEEQLELLVDYEDGW